MRKKPASAKAAAAAIEHAPEAILNADAQPTQETTASAATEAITVTDTKRARSYSQSAVHTEDLERLNQLKTFVKEKLNVTVSNQRIIGAALDFLGEHVEAFLQNIAADASNKQLAKERKAYEALKAKFEASEAPAAA